MKNKKFLIATVIIGAIYAAMRIVAYKTWENDSIDDDNPYTIHADADEEKKLLYVTTIKPLLAHILLFIELVVLSPVYAIIAIAIKIDDPGPVFFSQKRVGKDNNYFMCHNIRAMKIGTAGSLGNKGFLGDIDEKSFQNLIIFGHKVEHKVA